MELRDFFAGQIVAGMFASQGEHMGIITNSNDGYHKLAFECYKFADALIDVRADHTDSQQLQSVITDLQYVDSVTEQHGIVNGSKCHEMIKRSIERLASINVKEFYVR